MTDAEIQAARDRELLERETAQYRHDLAILERQYPAVHWLLAENRRLALENVAIAAKLHMQQAKDTAA